MICYCQKLYFPQIFFFGHIELFLDVVYNIALIVVVSRSLFVVVRCVNPRKLENQYSDVDETWSVLFLGHY